MTIREALHDASFVLWLLAAVGVTLFVLSLPNSAFGQEDTPTDTPTSTATATATRTPAITAEPRGTWVAEVRGNKPHRLQFDDRYPWSCLFPTALSSVTHTATYLQGGDDGDPCVGLVTNLQVDGSDTTQAIWLWTPGDLDEDTEHVCWVHIIAVDVGGMVETCDGSVIVRQDKPGS